MIWLSYFPISLNAYNPSNNTVYVTNLANNTVSVIDAATDVVMSTIPLSSFSGVINIPDSNSPSLIAYVKDNGALYVSKVHMQSQ